MKKKFLSFITVMVLLGSVCMTAIAEEESSNEPVQRTGTAAELKSYGAIFYQKGSDTIRIDSDDLYMLADQIDQVKLDVTDQLEAMHTYFTAGEGEIILNTNTDISVVHARPFETDAIDPLCVDFDTLLEGIAVSQSVSSDVTAYGYPAGTNLYKDVKGLLTTDGSGTGTEKISVTAASADNLSAGTAAWINGELLLGTGEDSQRYYQNGYTSGYNSGYSAGKTSGKPQIAHKVRIDSEDKHGLDLYVGSQQYFLVVGTNNFTCSPSPTVLCSDYNFVMCRINATSNGGYVHFPQFQTSQGMPVMLYYLSFS